MKTQNLFLSMALVAAVAVTGCKKESAVNGQLNTQAGEINIGTKPLKTVSGQISTNTTFYRDTVYQLDGLVYVAGADNTQATLTIQPGTIIVGKMDGRGTGKTDALIITRGNKINAAGTAELPIIFTSKNKIDNNVMTAPVAGDFGGLVILGRARSNNYVTDGSKTKIEGVPTVTWDASYGGGNDADNSGVLQYVRVEYAGFAIATDQEINSFTFGAVGSGTIVDHCEAYYGKDDGFEFFGGAVNASYLISFAQEDDGLDFDNGYSGTINYAIIQADPAGSHSTKALGSTSTVTTTFDSNGIESDNDSKGSVVGGDVTDYTLITNPKLNHIVVIGLQTNPGSAALNTAVSGGGLLFGARFRRNTSFEMINSIIIGYPVALRVEGGAGRKLVGRGGDLATRYSYFYNNYMQAFTTGFEYNTQKLGTSGVGIDNETGTLVPTAADANDTWLSTSRTWKQGVTASNQIVVGADANTISTGVYVFTQPFVYGGSLYKNTDAVSLVKAKTSTLSSVYLGHLGKTTTYTTSRTGVVTSKDSSPSWGKGWTAGTYGL